MTKYVRDLSEHIKSLDETKKIVSGFSQISFGSPIKSGKERFIQTPQYGILIEIKFINDKVIEVSGKYYYDLDSGLV